ncbi:hypothetical protein ABZ756_13685 [Mammaliicoccus sciuri]
MSILQKIFIALKEAFKKIAEVWKRSRERNHTVSQTIRKRHVEKRIIQSSPSIKWDTRKKNQVIDKRPLISYKKIIGR